jgi:hypothetical protein
MEQDRFTAHAVGRRPADADSLAAQRGATQHLSAAKSVQVKLIPNGEDADIRLE